MWGISINSVKYLVENSIAVTLCVENKTKIKLFTCPQRNICLYTCPSEISIGKIRNH